MMLNDVIIFRICNLNDIYLVFGIYIYLIYWFIVVRDLEIWLCLNRKVIMLILFYERVMDLIILFEWNMIYCIIKINFC